MPPKKKIKRKKSVKKVGGTTININIGGGGGGRKSDRKPSGYQRAPRGFNPPTHARPQQVIYANPQPALPKQEEKSGLIEALKALRPPDLPAGEPQKGMATQAQAEIQQKVRDIEKEERAVLRKTNPNLQPRNEGDYTSPSSSEIERVQLEYERSEARRERREGKMKKSQAPSESGVLSSTSVPKETQSFIRQNAPRDEPETPRLNPPYKPLEFINPTTTPPRVEPPVNLGFLRQNIPTESERGAFVNKPKEVSPPSAEEAEARKKAEKVSEALAAATEHFGAEKVAEIQQEVSEYEKLREATLKANQGMNLSRVDSPPEEELPDKPPPPPAPTFLSTLFGKKEDAKAKEAKRLQRNQRQLEDEEEQRKKEEKRINKAILEKQLEKLAKAEEGGGGGKPPAEQEAPNPMAHRIDKLRVKAEAKAVEAKAAEESDNDSDDSFLKSSNAVEYLTIADPFNTKIAADERLLDKLEQEALKIKRTKGRDDKEYKDKKIPIQEVRQRIRKLKKDKDEALEELKKS